MQVQKIMEVKNNISIDNLLQNSIMKINAAFLLSKLGGILNMLLLSILFFYLTAGHNIYACDTLLVPSSDSTNAYQQRDTNRCEGFYRSKVNRPDIEVVAVLRGKLIYELLRDEEISIKSSYTLPIFIQAQALPLKTYYRMDARLMPGSTLKWPISDILFPNKLPCNKIGLLGFIKDSDLVIYIPVSTTAAKCHIINDSHVRIIFRASQDLTQIHYCYIRGSTRQDWSKNMPESVLSEKPIIVSLPDSITGLVAVGLAATNDAGVWTKKFITIQTGEK